jgi:hypothetical protein
MIVLVLYCKIFSMEAARRCSRCNGKGRERNRRADECTRCTGTGVRPDGWAYAANGQLADDLEVGDVVLCPPTPYSDGTQMLATVVARDAERYMNPDRPLKEIIRRVGHEWPEGVPSR